MATRFETEAFKLMARVNVLSDKLDVDPFEIWEQVYKLLDERYPLDDEEAI